MNAVVLLSALVLVGQASARLQWQRLPTATGADRLRVRSAYAIALEGTQYPYLFNDGNILGAGYYAYARTGASIGGNTFGVYYDKSLAPITTSTAPVAPAVNTRSNYPAYSSVLNFLNSTTITVPFYNFTDVNGDGSNLTVAGPFNKTIPAGVLYSVTGFEKGLPSPVYLTTLTQESENGTLYTTATTPVPTANVFGILSTAGGDTTAAQTHLGTENTILDAKVYTAAYVAGTNKAKDPIVSMVKATTTPFNVYNYGYVWEASVTPAAVASASIVKHFSMGRTGATTIHVMPDQKTVYMANSGSGQAIFMYVATTAGDFTDGCLHALQVGTQTGNGTQNSQNGAYIAGGLVSFAAPTWIQLGCASDATVDNLRKTKTFANIFTVAAVPKTKVCAGTAKLVRNDATFKPECATLVGTPTMAAFLEPRRYAAYLGATVDWNTANGFAYDSRRDLLYFSIGQVTNSMLNQTTDLALNHINIVQNICGMIFSMTLGTRAGSDYAATRIDTLLGAGPITTKNINNNNVTVQNRIGGYLNSAFVPSTYITRTGTKSPYTYTVVPTKQPAYNSTNDLNINLNNVCDISNIANPKELSYVPGHDQLVIGEDSSFGHQNDMLWVMDLNYATEITNFVPPAAQYSYNPTQLTRIATAPAGSEWTSVNWLADINGFAYLSATVQHPFTEDSNNRFANATANITGSTVPAFEAYVGYIGWNLAYLYYLEVGQVGGFYKFGTLCAQGTDPNDAACDDGKPTTLDTCANDGIEYFWRCKNTPIPYAPCTSGPGGNETTACTDADPCNFNSCVLSQGSPPGAGEIGNCQAIPGNPSCVACNATAPCNDNNNCTVDICTDGTFNPITGDPRIRNKGVCAFIQPYGAESNTTLCTPCNRGAPLGSQCDDNNTCTLDQCSTGLSPAANIANGVCTSVFPVGVASNATNCAVCTSVATCNDLDDCTFDDCVAPDADGNFVSVTGGASGICVSTLLDGCESCTTSAEQNLTCANLTSLYPYDPTFATGFLNVSFPNLPNYTATPYCLQSECFNKRCQPNTNLALSANCRCGGFNPAGGPVPVCPVPPLCKKVGCVPFSNTCNYSNLQDGLICGQNPQRTCRNGLCV